MADVKIQLRDFKRRLLKAITEDYISNDMMLKIGDYAVKVIRDRTRRGYGVDRMGGNLTRLTRLSPRYIARREAKSNKLSQFTEPRTSNLTFTGQLLSSLKVNRVTQGRSYISPSWSRNDGGPNNARLAEYVSEKRPFNNLAKSEINDVAKYYRSNFADIARKNLLT